MSLLTYEPVPPHAAQKIIDAQKTSTRPPQLTDCRRRRACMGVLRTGTASWTDPTLLAAGWYPDNAGSAEDKLRYYASQFPVVEVDSTYYSMPAERSAQLWVERTPENFCLT
jgi:hypothetical protein